MSRGERLLLSEAMQALEHLRVAWRAPQLEVVGSVRRGLPHVGDIEVIAEIPPAARAAKPRPEDDPFFRLINATMELPWSDEPGTLFGVAKYQAIIPLNPLGKIVRGLKPGFLAASLIMTPFGRQVPLQVYRYIPANRGWVTLMRTGPREFGQWFLGQWKRRWRIPDGEQASRDGFLVNAAGDRVETPTEEETFKLCGMDWIAPGVREQVAASVRTERREIMR